MVRSEPGGQPAYRRANTGPAEVGPVFISDQTKGTLGEMSSTSPPSATGTLFWLPVILGCEDLDATETLIMVTLADHVNADDEAWPSIERLARGARVSERTAQRRLKDLEVRGYIVRTHRFRPNGSRTTDAFRIIRDRLVGGDRLSGGEVTDWEGAGDTRRHPPGDTAVSPPEVPRENHPSEHTLSSDTEDDPAPSLPLGETRPGYNADGSLKAPAAIARNEYPYEFDKTWEVWPPKKRTAKRGTYRAWRTAVHRLHGDDDLPTVRAAMVEIFYATERYVAHQRALGTELQFYKMPQTFYGPDDHFRDYMPGGACYRADADGYGNEQVTYLDGVQQN